MKALRILMVSALALAATTARAQENPFKLEIHGFVTGSMYYQQEVFAGGQGQALLLASPSPANYIDKGDSSSLGGDIRQSRWSFSVTGPAAFGGTPRAYLEFDLFGGAGAGSLGAESVVPRIRTAWAELKFGNTVFTAGQQNQLVIGQIPESVAHIANPMAYGAGLIGWRTPGFRLTQTMPMDGWKVALAGEVVRSRWGNANAATSPGTISEGEASSLPMIQARAMADGKAGDLTWMAYVAGAYAWYDLNGVGSALGNPAASPTTHEITSYAAELGGKFTFSPVVLAFNAYVGQATGPLVGALFQYGDIADMGAWAQVGVYATKQISVWGIYGMGRPDKADVRKWAGNSARIANDMYGGEVKYADGGYAFALEAYQIKTEWSTSATTSRKTDATQVILSAHYGF